MKRLSWGLFVGALLCEIAIIDSWHLSLGRSEMLGGLVALTYLAGLTRGASGR
jgi:hypothetical protein